MNKQVKYTKLLDGEKFTSMSGKHYTRYKKTLDVVPEGEHIGYCIDKDKKRDCFGLSALVYKGWI